ncbi:Hypothetical protein NCS54_00032800 [Fusarium falciforme]|uniref:Hypothetical protein n=1 Tax=Fusarium falciforme TaxID=195108 RepID=UPI0023007EB0|nr:Hypothetical protein NCS54_00032800 [Fusarium falciforme]WAO83147.1 Hypothetical protein NCS54_00032800 [Fusarium falciforme]
MGSQLYPMRLPQYVHFHRTFRQVDEWTWIIGGRLLITLLDSPKDRTSWPVGDGAGWYHASEAPNPRPRSSPIQDPSRFKLLRSWQEEGAMWEIGQCVLRAELRVGSHDTKEADTLRALEGRVLSLQVPVVYASFEFDGYEYIIHSKLDGVPLNTVWKDLDADHKNRCVLQIARFCRELASWERRSIEGVGGVNGSHMRDGGLLIHPWIAGNTPQAMLENCVAMGLDCSKLVFAHNILAPQNVIFHCEPGASEGRVVGIQNWTYAGFVPEGRIRACVGLYDDNLGEDWQRLFHLALSAEGFSVPEMGLLMSWKREMEPERSVLMSQYWATAGRQRRLRAEQHILDVTKPSENPGVPRSWDDIQLEGYPELPFSVSQMIIKSFYYPQR